MRLFTARSLSSSISTHRVNLVEGAQATAAHLAAQLQWFTLA